MSSHAPEEAGQPHSAVRSEARFSLAPGEVNALLGGIRSVLEERQFAAAARDLFDTCKALTGATAGYITLLSEDGTKNEVLLLDAGGRPCSVDPSLPMPLRGLRAEAYRTNAAVADNDFANSDWMRFMPDGHVRLENVLVAPLAVDGRTLGLLGLANKPGGFSERDTRIAAAFGELAAIALRHTRVSEEFLTGERRFRSLVETARDAIVTMDDQGTITTWNAAAETLFGYPAGDVVGRPVSALMPERFREAHRTALERARTAGALTHSVWPQVFIGLSADGREFPLELSVAQWHAEGRVFFTGILRDITERQRIEQELREHRQRLEETVRLRTQRLETEVEEHRRTEERLRQSTETQATLIGEINHRVRNNLSEILSLLQHEQERVEAAGCEIGRLSLQTLENRVRGLAAVHDLLSASGWRPVCLSELCTEVVRTATAAVPANRPVQVDVPAAAIGIASDRVHHVALVLNELATNSVKHASRRNGKLCIRAEAALEGGNVLLCFADNGPGFPEGVRNGSGDPGGTGLQLVRGIVGHSLRGTVRLRNDGGAVVEIRFPAEPAAATEAPA